MVSHAWRSLVTDESIWKRLCKVWAFVAEDSAEQSLQRLSYKDYFKDAYITMMNWRHGGHLLRSHRLPSLSTEPASLHHTLHSHQPTIPLLPSFPHPHLHPHLSNQTPNTTISQAAETGVVTSLALDSDWVVVGLAGSRIHVFSAHTGVLARTLVGHEAGVWGVCLVSRGGGPKGKEKEKEKGKEKGKTREKFEDAFDALDLNSDHDHSRAGRSDSKPSVSADGFTTVTPKKGRKSKGNGKGRVSVSVPEQDPGVGIVGQADGGDSLDYLVSPNLRIALGLGPEGKGEGDGAVEEGREREQQGVGGRGVVDEDAEDEAGPCPATPAYVPDRQSDPCFASEGWGQPNALVVSGGCDKVIRVWDVKSGYCIYTLPGHTSTIRCMRVLHGRPIAVTGSRDGTVRVWDVQRGRAVRCLRGHGGSVRCLDVNGKRAVSGSYDMTCRLWNIDTGECLHDLRGHFSQIYSVAFDGVRVASGGLDTTVRIWDAETGQCTALLQGHTALVCQLQLSPSHSLLATGGSDGRVITFSLSTYLPLHRLAAHDSSVTALQFDGRFLVTGGNDGRVRLFETGSGRYVRELSEEGECVWKVGYTKDGTCAVMGKRAGKTVMEIWSFRPREG